MLLDSFNVTAPNANGLTLNSITVNTGRNVMAGGLAVSNLKAYVTQVGNASNAGYFGQAQAMIYPQATYMYNGSFSVPANGVANVELFGDITSAAAGTYTTPFAIVGASGIAANGNVPVSFTGNVLGQNITVVGSVSVATSSVSVQINGSHGPLSVSAGAQLTITVATNNVTTCTENGSWNSGWVSSVPSPQTITAPFLAATTTLYYGVTCGTNTGVTVSDSVQVNVSPASVSNLGAASVTNGLCTRVSSGWGPTYADVDGGTISLNGSSYIAQPRQGIPLGLNSTVDVLAYVTPGASTAQIATMTGGTTQDTYYRSIGVVIATITNGAAPTSTTDPNHGVIQGIMSDVAGCPNYP